MPTRFVLRNFAIALLVVCLPGSATAQVAGDSSAQAPTGAPVVYGGDTLFTIYGHLGPFGPRERAEAIVIRLARLERRLGMAIDSVQVVEGDLGSEILIGDEVVMTVMDADVVPGGLSRSALASGYANRILQAAAAAVWARSPTGLIVEIGKTILATAGLILLLYGLRVLFNRLYGFLRGPGVPPLHLKRFELLSARRFSEVLTAVARGIRVVVTLLLFYIYVPLVLSFFPWTAPYAAKIVGYVVTPLKAVGTGFLEYLPKIFFIAVIVLVTRYLLKLIRLLFQALSTGALAFEGFQRDWAGPTYNIVRFLVIAFAAVVMFPYLPGAGSDAFKGVSLFVGVLFSLGSSGAVGNIVAGVVLTYTNAFRVGDRVRIGETVGDVFERTLLVTRVRTIKNVDITIPNGSVLSSQVINYSTQAESKGLILHTTVTIGYDAPWPQVHKLLIEGAKSTTNILADPEPFVLQTSLDDFYVSYEINAYTDKPSVMAVTYSELHQHIQDQFNKGGVEIMSPHYRSLREGNQVTIPAEHLEKSYRAPAFRVEQVPPPDRGE